jgi:CMP-2-keto-3-deoxyoctulosonic acid synthetase
VDASSIANSVQHQAAEARVARTQPAQTGTARPAAATAAGTNAPKPADAVTGDKPNTPATPIKDAITKLVKTGLLNQLTGGFGKFLGPSR